MSDIEDKTSDKGVIGPATTMAVNSGVSQPPAMLGTGNLAENWRDWKQTFDWYLIAAGREKSSGREKCALLLHVIGKAGRDLYEEFDIGESEKANYELLCRKFASRCDPQKNVNFERHLFFEAYQANEDFDRYLASLRVKSKSCEFGALKESLILTQVIRGIKDGQLRESMLRKKDLLLEEAVAWCRAAEIASERASAVHGAGHAGAAAGAVPVDIEQVRARPRRRAPAPPPPPRAPAAAPSARRGQPPQRRVGGTGDRLKCSNCDYVHERDQCPAYNVKCYRCDRFGHFMRCCRSNYVREVRYDSEELGDCEELIIQGIEILSIENKGWFESVEVNGVPVNFKLDSGADACVISRDCFQKAGYSEDILCRTGTVLREKFKFCSDGDCPLWALAALHALGSLPATLFRALLQHITDELPEDGIMDILKDTSLSSREESARAAAAIRWVLRQTWRGGCPGPQLTRDLLVLGLPRTHATALAEAADAGRDAYEAKVQTSGFMVNRLTDVTTSAGPEGTVDTIKLTLHAEDVTGERTQDTLLVHKTQVKTLLKELKQAYQKMEELDNVE